MAGRARKTYNLESSVALFLDEELPYNSTLLQVSAKFDPAPTTNEPFTAQKISVDGTAYDILFGTIDPALYVATSLICDDEVEFRKGDSIRISYDNTDTVDIGLEAIFKEAD